MRRDLLAHLVYLILSHIPCVLPVSKLNVGLRCAQTDMGGDIAPRSVEDGARAIAWGYLSPKVQRDDFFRLIRYGPCLLYQNMRPQDALS